MTAWTSTGQIGEVQRSTVVGGNTITESYLYTYLTTGVNAGLLSNVTLRQQTNGGAWTTIQQVQYTYYDGTTSYGNQGDLELAQTEDGSGNVLDTDYYRYYTPADASSGGYVGGLKYVFNSDSYARLTAALGSTSPMDATDSDSRAVCRQFLRVRLGTRGNPGNRGWQRVPPPHQAASARSPTATPPATTPPVSTVGRRRR